MTNQQKYILRQLSKYAKKLEIKRKDLYEVLGKETMAFTIWILYEVNKLEPEERQQAINDFMVLKYKNYANLPQELRK